MVSTHHPYFLVIMEPKISGRKAHGVIRQLGFLHSHHIEAMGFLGDIRLCWKDNDIDVDVLFNKH